MMINTRENWKTTGLKPAIKVRQSAVPGPVNSAFQHSWALQSPSQS